MDKKNTVIGVLLIIAAIASMYIGNRNSMERPTTEALRQAVGEPAPPTSAPPSIESASPPPVITTAGGDRTAQEIKTALHNDFIEVQFSNFGGAIRSVALQHKLRNGLYQFPSKINEPTPFVFNGSDKDIHIDEPALAIIGYPGLDQNTPYQLVSKSDTEVVYRATIPGRIEVTRRYVLAPDSGTGTDPYQLRTETTLRNLSPNPSKPMQIGLAVGTSAPVNDRDTGRFLAAWYSSGKSASSIPRMRLEASAGFFGLGIGAHPAAPSIDTDGPIAWAAVSNQFFVGILTPDAPCAGLTTRRVYLLTEFPESNNSAYGVTDAARFAVPELKPGETTTLGANYYAGPKEYHRLSNTDVFKLDQDLVMQFGFFKFFSALLLTLMTWIHTIVPNWGLSVILTTLALKTIFIYPTLASLRSSRRMQKIQPQLKAINEKYKDNPQKKNQATMELFKLHKVNPLGGCIPMIITMPFFFGFYSMLWSTADLRFAHFLWAADLSAPDTVLSIGHGMLPLIGTFNLNLLPIIMAAVSFVQFRISPQPTVDNAQAKMMMFSPLIMLIFYYNFSCALSLYSTTNGLFTIAQQLVINRMRDDGDPAAAKAAAGKATRNVTAQKRK